MVSLILYAALALVVAAVVVAVLVVVLPDDTVSAAARDRIPAGLPSGRLAADDVSAVRLPVGLRGYRMVDTDAVLDRLGAELLERDQEIARLRAGGVDARAGEADPPSSPKVSGGQAASLAATDAAPFGPAEVHPAAETVHRTQGAPSFGAVPSTPAGERS